MAELIKLCDIRRQYTILRSAILKAIDEVLQDMNLFLGPNVAAFEREWANFCNTKHAIGVDNGTDGLLLTLCAYGIKEGDEVITPANTFGAVVEAILAVRATPVFVDINPDTFNIDIECLKAAITSHTRAIVPVHLFGLPADMDSINNIAQANDIIVIEDASQAQGAKYKGKRVGGLAKAAVFSLYYTKNLGGYGESGIFTTNSDEVSSKMDMLRQHGANAAVSRYNFLISGYNSRLDEIQAAILRIKLRYLDEWNNKRRFWAARYTELLSDSVITPKIFEDYESAFYVYVIRVPNRDELKNRLLAEGIETGIHYPLPLHLQPICSHLGYRKGQFPITEQFADEILSLPMFPELTEEEIERISKAVTNSV
jgi:dTDP-4-amino-4,6-dideoxygalactose transaminase